MIELSRKQCSSHNEHWCRLRAFRHETHFKVNALLSSMGVLRGGWQITVAFVEDSQICALEFRSTAQRQKNGIVNGPRMLTVAIECRPKILLYKTSLPLTFGKHYISKPWNQQKQKAHLRVA
ncbi:hypothetical protein TNCV_4116801 [Trichonephila clavipes]|nr:hypothetical protein TNCV_4116801 [Trichonephila clavipes]